MDEQQEQFEEAQPQDPTKRRRRVERRYRFASRKQRRLPQLRWWREALLVLLLATAVLFLINPFTRLAQSQATVARPVEPLAVTPPTNPEEGYCLTGDFLDWNGRSTPLLDDGTSGDRTAGDNLYSRTITFEEPGRYLWRVLPCGQWNSAVPEKSAWVFATAPNQPITFTFNPEMPPSRLWPRSYAFTANDTLPARVVAVGSFQPNRWDSEDTQTQMDPSGNGQFQLAYRIPLPSSYQAYVLIQGRDEGVGASGRSMEPIPLEFSTEFPAEMVVIQYDARTDRISVLSGMPWWLSWLGFGWGARLIAAFALVGFLVLGAQVGYSRVVQRPDWQYSAGCPNCQQHDFKRITREMPDYLLDLIGVPVRRYKCNHCDWEGRRIYRRRS
ncbi:choice-of-anchor X domain-containing protein [Candidatus Leptofilum sp.]|uniref:choice-of-anchor X domain-containing protein n=1 Tax=Candidatus Leptofilum sp. TaxID=3241576 RepID=UPI003B5CEB77